MSKRTKKLSAFVMCSALVIAACGGDDDDAAPATEPSAEETDESTADEPAEPTAEESSDDMSDESTDMSDDMSEEPTDDMSDEPTEEPETDEIVMKFDANGDGTVTIGVAAAGPRDDNGYYQSLVDFAQQFSADNGFADPIVSDNIGAEEAAQAMSDLAQQGVDIMFVGASEIAEPLPDLTEAFPDVFWYCNCGAGFAELPGLAQATDWGAAIHYTAGVAMGQTLIEQGSTQSVFLGCCDLNFEREALNATLAGMHSVDESLTMEYVATGDFPFDFDNSGNATAALTNAQANGATLAYAYLGGATDPVGQLATEQGLAVFAAGPADICDRDDGIAWTGSVVFDGGRYAAQALRLIIAGDLDEGSTYQFPTEAGLNGVELCDPSPETEAAVADAFGLLASFDEDLMGQLGAISGEAYSGG